MSTRHRIIGAVAVAVVLAGGVAAYGSYTGAFSDQVVATVRTDRSGLLLESGSDVALRRVDVGKVLDVVQEGPDDVRIRIAVDRDDAAVVPATATARIVSSTLLAPKYVDLAVPDVPGTRTLEDGAVLESADVQTEINTAFESLMGVLQQVDPAKLNSALGGLSVGLQQRGDELGTYLERGEAYAAALRPSYPTLQRDLTAAADVATTYADVAPQLLQVLDNATTTGDTLVDQRVPFEAFLAGLDRLGDSGQGFLARNEEGLVSTFDVLEPTTALAARYSPMFPCLFATLNQLRRSIEPAAGGTYPGLYTSTTPLPGSEGYRVATDLPQVRADEVTCSGGPIPLEEARYPRVAFDDGSPDIDTTDTPVTPGSRPLAVMLFGEEAADEVSGR